MVTGPRFPLGGNLSLRWGATRVNQVGLVLLGLGTAALSIPSFATVIPASLSLGMGYGALTPSASHILVRYTPAHRRNIVFSLKQSGVPLGGVLTATLMPVITVTAGWQWTLWLDACAAIAMAFVMERWRKRWDDDRVASTPLATNPLGAVAIIWQRPRLRLMAFAGAGIVASQICMQTYTVAMFYEQYSLPLIEAGWILTVAQVGGVCGRLFWGWYADRMAAGQSTSLFGKQVSRFELGRTEKTEADLLDIFDHVLVTSGVDRNALLDTIKIGKTPAPISILSNGVDQDYFHPNPDAAKEPETLVFSGKMSYHAKYFHGEVSGE